MKSVKVNKTQLLAALEENKEGHKEEYEKAYEGYIQTCLDVLQQNLKNFKEEKPTRLYIVEAAPEDHTKDYERAIEMLKMSVDDIVEITEQEFAQLVLDDWQWKIQWEVANSKYSNYTRLQNS